MPGYRVTTVDAVKGGIVCPHCNLVLRDAVQTIEEGHRLCESCYEEICLKPDRKCTECGILIGADEQIYPDRAVRREIQNLEVRCDYHTFGCTWKGQLKVLEVHCNECWHQPAQCPSEGFEQTDKTKEYQETKKNEEPVSRADLQIVQMFRQVFRPTDLEPQAMEILGNAMNPIVAHLHNARFARGVKFRIQVCCSHGRCTKWVPVADPTSRERCPEAFDGYSVLRHIKCAKHIGPYTRLFDTTQRDLRHEINDILEKGRKGSQAPPSQNAASAQINRIITFLMGIEASLTRNNEATLASRIPQAIGELTKLKKSIDILWGSQLSHDPPTSSHGT